jgi:hypothetical protein
MGLGTSFGQLAANEAGIINNHSTGDVIFGTNGTERVTIDGATGNVGIGTASPASNLHILHTDADAAAGPIVTLQRDNSAGEDNGDILGEIKFQGSDSANTITTEYSTIHSLISNVSNTVEEGTLVFKNMVAGTSTTAMTIAGSKVGIGTVNPGGLPATVSIRQDNDGGVGAVLQLVNDPGGSTSAGTECAISFNPHHSGEGGEVARISAIAENTAARTAITFKTHTGSSGTEKMRISSQGLVGIGTDAPVTPLDVHSAGTEVAAVFGMADDGNVWVSTRTAETLNNYGAYAFMVGSAAVDGVGSSNCTGYINSTVKNSGGTLQGNMQFQTNGGDSLGTRMTITEAGDVSIGDTSPFNGAKFTVYEDANDEQVAIVNVTNGLGHSMIDVVETLDTSETSFNFITMRSQAGTDGTLTHRVRIEGDGELFADNTTNLSDADYAEFFEVALTEHTASGIPPGVAVALTGSKVIPASQSNAEPFGVIRPNKASMIVGNAGWAKWNKMYMSDDYGAPLYEEHTWTIWYENSGSENEVKHAYHSDRIPSGVTTGSDAIIETHRDNTSGSKNAGKHHFRRVLNPDFNGSLQNSYTPRSERNEWVIVGLLGQIPITNGQPTGSSWKKMGNISDTVSMWFVK